eukprot:1627944-Pyramimonas_sp.AAC.1
MEGEWREGQEGEPVEQHLQRARERQLLEVLCRHEAARLRLWAEPLAFNQVSSARWRPHSKKQGLGGG